jgi:hypothetical protein
MRLCLPLTLAIIDGFLVGVGDARFVLPLEMVVECIELPAGGERRPRLSQPARPGAALPAAARTVRGAAAGAAAAERGGGAVRRAQGRA